MNQPYTINSLSRDFNITPRALRFYEDKGMLRPARDGQRRIYSPRDRVRLRLIMRGKRLGLSLEEIAELIDLYDVDPSEVTQLRQFIEVIRIRMTALEAQRRDIDDALGEMRRIEKQCADLLAQKQSQKKGSKA